VVGKREGRPLIKSFIKSSFRQHEKRGYQRSIVFLKAKLGGGGSADINKTRNKLDVGRKKSRDICEKKDQISE